jgi:uncharacterized protein (DUF111 family)
LRDDGVEGERVTPTGAAILAELVDDPVAEAYGCLAATGHGAGIRTLPGLPNVLRALVFTGAISATESVVILSFDVDDMTGEEIGIALARLRTLNGVLDVSLGTRFGKKGRPLSDFRLLVAEHALSAVRDACLRETSTIGLRWRREQRLRLDRSERTQPVGGHSVRTKTVSRPGVGATVKAESDDLATLDGLVERRHVQALAESAR